MDFELLKDVDKEVWLADGIRKNSVKREPETVHWCKRLKKGVFYDIGANIGAYSLIASKWNKELQVFAFEPMIRNFWLLNENVIKNELENNLHIFNIPLSKTSGLGDFNIMNIGYGKSGHAFGNSIDWTGKKFNAVSSNKMLALSINDLVNIYKFPKPNYIKLDVDGIEFEILKGATDVFDTLKEILFEASIDSKHINNFLKTYDYNLVKIFKHRHTNNYLFRKQ